MSIERPYCLDDYMQRIFSLKETAHRELPHASPSRVRQFAGTLESVLIDVRFAGLREGNRGDQIIACIDAQQLCNDLEPHSEYDEDVRVSLAATKRRINRILQPSVESARETEEIEQSAAQFLMETAS